jgi:hypothetical protein
MLVRGSGRAPVPGRSYRKERGGVGACREAERGHQPLAHAADAVVFDNPVFLMGGQGTEGGCGERHRGAFK